MPTFKDVEQQLRQIGNADLTLARTVLEYWRGLCPLDGAVQLPTPVETQVQYPGLILDSVQRSVFLAFWCANTQLAPEQPPASDETGLPEKVIFAIEAYFGSQLVDWHAEKQIRNGRLPDMSPCKLLGSMDGLLCDVYVDKGDDDERELTEGELDKWLTIAKPRICE